MKLQEETIYAETQFTLTLFITPKILILLHNEHAKIFAHSLNFIQQIFYWRNSHDFIPDVCNGPKNSSSHYMPVPVVFNTDFIN